MPHSFPFTTTLSSSYKGRELQPPGPPSLYGRGMSLSGGLSLDLLFHFCLFLELMSLDLKRIITHEVCINQRNSEVLGRGRLVTVSPQPIRVPEKSPTLDSVCMCVSLRESWRESDRFWRIRDRENLKE